MEKISVHDKTFKPYIPNSIIEEAIKQVADKLNRDFFGCEDVPILLCILNGAIMFTSELMKHLRFNCQLLCTKLSSYRGTETTGEVKMDMNLTADVKGRRVIIVEDIIDSGTTIVAIQKILRERGALKTYICTMLFKEEAYKADEKIDYCAMKIKDRFIMGFGLDYDELGRNLPDIWMLDSQD